MHSIVILQLDSSCHEALIQLHATNTTFFCISIFGIMAIRIKRT